MSATQPSGAGLADMRRSNAHSILAELYRASPATRTELARATGLTKPTVSAALHSLGQAGLAEPAVAAQAPAKYGAELFQAAGRSLPVLGIDIGTRFVRAQLAGLDDALLAEADFELDAPPTLASVFDAIDSLRADVCASAGVAESAIQAVGVGVPGVVDPHSDTITMAGGIPGLDGYELRRELAEHLGVAVIVENDVNLAAIAESLYGACVDIREFSMLSVGAGVGASLVLGGRLHRGRRGGAGELDVLFAGPAGRRLLPDPSAPALTEYAIQHYPEADADTIVGQPIELPQLFEAATKGDVFANNVVDEGARRIAELCACLMAVVDVSTIVVVGGIGAALGPARAAVESRLAELLPWPPAVIESALGRSGTVMGARSIAVRHARTLLFESNIGKTLHR